MRTKNLNNTQQSTPQTDMRDLPIKFVGKGEVRGFAFEQVYKDRQWYIYEVSSKGFSWYEVFHRRKVNGKEVYPKSKQFGITAWQVVSVERALLKIARFHESDTPSADDGLSMLEKKSCDLPKTLNKNRRSYDSTQQPNKTL